MGRTGSAVPGIRPGGAGQAACGLALARMGRSTDAGRIAFAAGAAAFAAQPVLQLRSDRNQSEIEFHLHIFIRHLAGQFKTGLGK